MLVKDGNDMKRVFTTFLLFAVIFSFLQCVDSIIAPGPPDNGDESPGNGDEPVVPNLSAEILLPVDGKIVGPQELSGFTIVVRFGPAAGSSIESNDISADLVNITDGSTAVNATSDSRLGTSNLFEFSSFSGLTASAG
ncbi:MAG: hypothetical protein KAU31_04155, partial [Spirochaetaceae bacterium]|nr:hypothetical protein [Spirochaetaceae bacterium]